MGWRCHGSRGYNKNKMDEQLRIRSILSLEAGLKNQGFSVQANLPGRFFKPTSIDGLVPDVMARRAGYCVGFCVEDNPGFYAGNKKYYPLREWLYAGHKEFFLSSPGELPNVFFTKLYLR